jgi:hypothetical protein
MQLWQRMVWHQRKHVVLDMVIHVPVEEPVDRIHVYRAAVEAMVEDVFRQAGVLGVARRRP